MKISTGKLLLILVGLAVIYGLTEIFRNSGKSKSIREELVNINQENVTNIVISKSESSFQLNKVSDDWEITLASGKKVSADISKVVNTLNSIQTIKPSRIATRSKEKWAEYQVDSTGTRIQIYENSEEPTLDMIIGRFGVQNQRDFYTYVRLSEENSVYVSDDFMGFSVSSESSGYRNQSITNLNSDSIVAVNFNYGDSSFVLSRGGESWLIDNLETDSTNTAEFMSNLKRLSSTNFYDEDVMEGASEVVIRLTQDSTITLAGNSDGNYFLLSSTTNPSHFNDSTLYHKVFKSRSYFTD